MEFHINEYLSLKLENGATVIYIAEKRYNQCKFLLFDIPNELSIPFNEINSIDEAAQKLDDSLENPKQASIKLSPETEFWGHCSNLQAWYEYGYDTRLLHSNLAFPLLKKLSNEGDPKAMKAFKEEIVKRCQSGYIPVIYYLITQNYTEYLDKDERSLLFLKINPKLHHQLIDIKDEWKSMSFYILFKLINWGDNMAEELTAKKNIHELNLVELYLTEIPQVISKLCALHKLNLQDNKLTNIPKEIGALTSLQMLDLSFNEIADIPKEIGALTSLQILDLHNNEIMDLPKEIGTLTSLEMLDLQNNKLTNLPKEIGTLTSLQALNLDNNNLIEFLEWIESLTSLKRLYLKNNPCVLQKTTQTQKILDNLQHKGIILIVK